MTSKNYVSTKVFASKRLVKDSTVRESYCRHGHYFGIRPIKLPNRRLAWPDDDPIRALNVEAETK